MLMCVSVLGTAWAVGSGTGGNSIPVVIESGSGVETASYIIYQDGDYTCVKNGTTGRIELRDENESLAIQTALGYNSARSTVLTYALIGNFTLDVTLLVPSYTRLDLRQATITVIDDFKGDVVNDEAIIRNSDTNTGNSQIHIIGGILDGNKATITTRTYLTGVLLRFVDNSSISDITIDSCKTFGIFVSRGSATVAYNNQSNDVKVSRCTVTNSGWDGIAVTADSVLVENCYVSNSGRCGITFEEARYSSIIGGSFVRNTEAGVDVTVNSIGIMISSVYVGYNTLSGIQVTYSKSITIDGCISEFNAQHGVYGTSDASRQIVGISISGCVLRNNTGWGARFTGAANTQNVMVSGNALDGNVGGSIYLDATYSQSFANVINDGKSMAIGSATILSGQTSIVVTHGLAKTPICVIVTGTNTEVKSCWVANVGATQFTIFVSNATSGNRVVYWQAYCTEY